MPYKLSMDISPRKNPSALGADGLQYSEPDGNLSQTGQCTIGKTDIADGSLLFVIPLGVDFG